MCSESIESDPGNIRHLPTDTPAAYVHQLSITPPIIDLISDELLTPAQAGRLLGVSPVSVWRYQRKGRRVNGRAIKLPAVPFGRTYVTTAAAIRWWGGELQRAASETTDCATSPRQRPGTQAERAALDKACEEAGI